MQFFFFQKYKYLVQGYESMHAVFMFKKSILFKKTSSLPNTSGIARLCTQWDVTQTTKQKSIQRTMNHRLVYVVLRKKKVPLKILFKANSFDQTDWASLLDSAARAHPTSAKRGLNKLICSHLL